MQTFKSQSPESMTLSGQKHHAMVFSKEVGLRWTSEFLWEGGLSTFLHHHVVLPPHRLCHPQQVPNQGTCSTLRLNPKHREVNKLFTKSVASGIHCSKQKQAATGTSSFPFPKGDLRSCLVHSYPSTRPPNSWVTLGCHQFAPVQILAP